MTQEHSGQQHDAGQQEPAAHTTSISLPDLAPVIDPHLSSEERQAVQALPAHTALLVSHAGADHGARFLLDEDTTTVGRHPDADIFLDDVTVSRRHAEFRRTAEGFDLVDMNSLNGTFVNQDRVDQLSLRTGMQVQIGKFRMTYYAGPQQG